MNTWLVVFVAGIIWFVVLTTAWAICQLCAEADARLAFERELEEELERMFEE